MHATHEFDVSEISTRFPSSMAARGNANCADMAAAGYEATFIYAVDEHATLPQIPRPPPTKTVVAAIAASKICVSREDAARRRARRHVHDDVLKAIRHVRAAETIEGDAERLAPCDCKEGGRYL